MNVPPDTAPQQPDDDARVDADVDADADADAPRTPAAPIPPAPLAPAPALPAPGLPTPVLPTQSREDTDVGWGDYAERGNDDRLLRDRPPHWDDH